MLPKFTVTTQRIEFKADGLRLHGILHLPKAPKPPVVIGSHGLLSDGNSPKQIALAKACNLSGIAYFRIHHRGCGKSEGDFTAVTSLYGRSRDIMAAAAHLTKNREVGQIIGLFGSSFGGTTCLAAAAKMPTLIIVSYAAPIFSDFLAKANRDVPDFPKALCNPNLRRNLVFDLDPILPRITNALIIHGDADQVVPHSHGLKIYSRIGSPKKLITLANGDHLMRDPKHQKAFTRAAVDWYCKPYELSDGAFSINT
jgi:alpha-beta hydrolase superfamily lysophospholipase